MPCDLYTLRFQLCGLSQASAAEYVGVSERTFRRWEKDGNPPLYAVKLLRLRAGFIEDINQAWAGWRIVEDELIPPAGKAYSRQWFDGLWVYWQQQRNREAMLRERVTTLEARLRFLERVPGRLPGPSNSPASDDATPDKMLPVRKRTG